MIKTFGIKATPIVDKVYVAVSGGVDSMAALDFILNGRYNAVPVHFNHGTEYGESTEKFLMPHLHNMCPEVITGHIRDFREQRKDESPEEYFRNARYDFFESLNVDIIMAHHLDDCVETYLMAMMHGNMHLIPIVRELNNGYRVYRPFLTTRKSDFRKWADKRNVPFFEDPSNKDTSYMRNYVRHALLPRALTVNPGLHKTVKKLIMKRKSEWQM